MPELSAPPLPDAGDVNQYLPYMQVPYGKIGSAIGSQAQRMGNQAATALGQIGRVSADASLRAGQAGMSAAQRAAELAKVIFSQKEGKWDNVQVPSLPSLPSAPVQGGTVSDIPLPPSGGEEAAPQVAAPQVPIEPSQAGPAVDKLYNTFKQAIAPQGGTPAAQPQEAQAPVVTPQTMMEVLQRTAPVQIARTGYNAISDLFKSKPAQPSAATAKPSPAGAPLAGKPVKVERFRNGLPVGSDDKIEIPPMPGRTTTSTTPIPYDTAAPAAGAAKPPMPAAPKAGAGAKPLGDKNSYRSWKLPDGRIVHTKPGEDPPAGAQQVK